MAVSFYKDANSWKINGSPVPNGVYRAFYQGTGATATITVVHPQFGNRAIISNETVSNILKEDGSTYADLDEFDAAVGDFFLSASVGGAGATITANHVFASDTARNTYFTTDPNHEELLPGLTIVSGNEIQRWAAATPATVGDYDGSNFVDITGASLTGAQIKILYEGNSDTNALTDAKLAILNHITENSDGDLVFDTSVIFPPGSVSIGDSIIESGGRIISAQSRSTGNQGAFIIQLFDTDSYIAATVYDPNQTAQTFDIQTTDDSVTSPATEINFRQVVQNDVQFQAIDFKPAGGSVTSDFTFEVRLTETGLPIYDETVSPSDVTDLTGGIFRYTLLNPSQLDDGFDAYVTVNGIALLGGPQDGSDGVRFGDTANSNFFPWLRSFSIPIVRQNIATENYVTTQLGTKQDDLGTPNIDDQIVVFDADGTHTFENLPTGGTDNYADSVDLGVNADSTVTITIGRTGTLSDLDSDFRLIAGSNVTLTPNSQDRTITITASGQAYHAPTLQNFRVDIASRVDLNTDLNTSHTFNWDAHNAANLATLVIQVTSGTNQTITLPINDGANSATFTLSGIDTSTTGTLTFQLVGTDTNSDSVTSNTITINIADVAAHEYLYDGLNDSNDFSTIDISGFDQQEVTGPSGQTFAVSTGAVTANQYFGILTLNSHTITIFDTVLQQDVTSIFTRTQNTRVIGGQNFDSYTIGPLNEDTVGQTYNVTIVT